MFKDQLIQCISHKNISFHLRRNTGRDTRWRGSSAIEGDIFNYESISPGQYFAGTISGSEEVSALYGCFSEGQDATDGVSIDRTPRSFFKTQYGEIELNLLPLGK